MRIIGITGNSGSGKSTVSKMISENYEAKIIDADKIAKEMTMNNGEYLQAIKQTFGEDVIKDNTLDRKKLADIVFSNKTEKEKLDSLTFEYVVRRIKEEIKKAQLKSDIKYIVLDVPLLFESRISPPESSPCITTSALGEFPMRKLLFPSSSKVSTQFP